MHKRQEEQTRGHHVDRAASMRTAICMLSLRRLGEFWGCAARRRAHTPPVSTGHLVPSYEIVPHHQCFPRKGLLPQAAGPLDPFEALSAFSLVIFSLLISAPVFEAAIVVSCPCFMEEACTWSSLCLVRTKGKTGADPNDSASACCFGVFGAIPRSHIVSSSDLR